MSANKIYSMLGLATRARGLVSGEFAVDKAVKEGTAFLVIVAGDASKNTKKEFSDMCSYYKVPYYEYGIKDELGHCMGKDERASVAITEAGFAKSIKKLLGESEA